MLVDISCYTSLIASNLEITCPKMSIEEMRIFRWVGGNTWKGNSYTA